MPKKVAIVSYGIMGYSGPNEIKMWNDEATFVASKQALDRVGLSREDIDAVVISTMDGLDGITISNSLLAPAAGAYRKDSIRIENSGIHCVISGIASILSDNADVVMVASSDTVEMDFGYVTNSNQDQFFRGPIGFNALQSYGLLSMDYMRRYDATEADFALAASKNYQCGASNPHAHVSRSYSMEEVLASTLVSWPLRALEIGNLSNGATAILLASEEKAEELTDKPVWITGFGAAMNSYFSSWEDLSGTGALSKASQRAYRIAGIKNPLEQIDFMEINNPFSPFELMACEALGICEEGVGLTLLRDGVTSVDGRLPVNLSGGTLCTNPPNSGGIFRIAQAMMHLTDGSGRSKLKNPKRGLVHDSDMSIGAIGGDSHAVLILEMGD